MNTAHWLEQSFGWITQTSWQAAVITALILMTQWLLRRRLSPTWRHSLWLVLVARLLMPSTPGSAFSVFNIQKIFQHRPAPIETASVTPQVHLTPPPAAIPDATAQAASEIAQPAATPTVLAVNAMSPALPSIATLPMTRTLDQNLVLTLIWLSGVALLGGRFLWNNHRFARALAQNASAPEPALIDLFNDCSRTLRVSEGVTFLVTDKIDSPSVFGVIHKHLLLPRPLCRELTSSELRHVMLHELAHVKRRDPELNWLIGVLQIVHWFNPVLWLAFSRLRADRELAADDLALAAAGETSRVSYGETIVKILEGLAAKRRVLPGLIGIIESKADIKRRLRAIALAGGPRWRFGAFGVAALLAGVALTGASEGASSPAKTPDQPAASVPASSEVSVGSPRVVSVFPADGAENVQCRQDVRIRFDRAMAPHYLNVNWRTGGFQPAGKIQVSDDGKEFTIPVYLTQGQKQTVQVNYRWDHRGRETADSGQPVAATSADFRDAAGIAAAEFHWSFATTPRSVASGVPAPKVVNVQPASGSSPELTFLEITFDQPMQPPGEMLPYMAERFAMGGPALIPSIDYDAAAHRFTIPALLPADNDARLNLEGFRGANGVAAGKIVLHYQTEDQKFGAAYREKLAASASDAALLQLLNAMKEARARLHSGAETVQTIQFDAASNAFHEIQSQTATFKWQGTNQAYADITGVMETGSFILGCDGQDCWIYSEDKTEGKRLDKTPVALTKCSVRLADPFFLGELPVKKALELQPLVRESDAMLDGHECSRLVTWKVNDDGLNYADKAEWWIDKQTSLVREMRHYYPDGQAVVVFTYTNLNETLPDATFQPPSSAASGTHSAFFEKLPVAGEQRFLTIHDGTGNGQISDRIGWHNEHTGSTTSSGLN